jgi:CheY-like chemotaxis protein
VPVTKNEKFCVLVVDDDICLTTIVTKALRNGLPNAEVLTARSVAEAQLLLSEFKIHFFILDINLPDGNGIDFLCDVRTLFPEARVMMITASPLPQYEQQTKELGVLLFRQKPVDTREMLQLVRSHYEKMGHGTSVQNSDGSFAVSLTCLSALDIIQLKCLSSATLVLQVASPRGIGRIYFENGEIVHAESPDARGEAAFEQILRWKGGRIKEMAPAYKPPRTIHTGWQGLLLNIAQKIDEAATATAP